MTSLQTTLHRVKETKRYVAYESEDDAEALLGLTYVRLEAAEQLGDPEVIVITVSAAG